MSVNRVKNDGTLELLAGRPNMNTIAAKADKVTSATNGNFAGLDINGNLTDAGWASDKTTTAVSGNPISISGLKSNQLAKDPIITLEPIQAGSGTPSPSNVRAISGYDKIEVLSCGKNLCDNSNNKTGGYYRDDGNWVVDSSHASSGLIPVVPNTTYRGCMYNKSTKQLINNVVYVLWSDTTTGTGQYTSATITTGADTKYITIRNYGVDASYITNNNFLFALELGDTSSTTFPEYNKTTDLSESLGQTVYGGSLDVRTGVLTVDKFYAEFDGSSDENWLISNSGTPNWFYYIDTVASTKKDDIISNLYPQGDIGNANTNKGINVLAGGSIRIRENSQDTVANFKARLAQNPLQIVIGLATPFTIQLTPHEISLLKDYAYVSTNGTNMSFSYHNGELASLGDVAQLGETVNELGETVNELPYGLLKSKTFTLTTDSDGRVSFARITDMIPLIAYNNQGFYTVIRCAGNDSNYYYGVSFDDAGSHLESGNQAVYTIYGLPIK